MEARPTGTLSSGKEISSSSFIRVENTHLLVCVMLHLRNSPAPQPGNSRMEMIGIHHQKTTGLNMLFRPAQSILSAPGSLVSCAWQPRIFTQSPSTSAHTQFPRPTGRVSPHKHLQITSRYFFQISPSYKHHQYSHRRRRPSHARSALLDKAAHHVDSSPRLNSSCVSAQPNLHTGTR